MPSPIDGGTVLITGTSSGIGREIARLVAGRAKTLLLVARRKDRLDELAAELKGKHASLEVRVYACDLGDRCSLGMFIEQVDAEGSSVDVLINNAGLGDMGVFDRTDLKKQLSMIDLNVAALVQLTHAFVPGMVARGKGAVLNISSGFGLGFTPGFATYVGTKHFVTGFTESLHLDLAGTGVVASQICPGPVATEFEEATGNFTGQKVPGFLELDAESCARTAVRAIDQRRALIIPHLFFWWLLGWSRHVPRWLVRAVMRPLAKYIRQTQAARG